ncbi:MAG: tetratricopeptide repeat protein, partial [Cyclobacteriaceae bacterium]
IKKPAMAIIFYLQAVSTYESAECKSRAYSNIGIIYKKYGLYEKAVAYYTKALHHTADTKRKGRFLINRAISYKKNGDYDSALFDAFYALEIGKNENYEKVIYQAYNQLGLIKKDVGEYKQAITYFSETSHLINKESSIINLGKTYFLLGSIDSARLYLHKAIDVLDDKKHFIANQILGEVYQDANKFNRAIRHFKAADKLYSEKSFTTLDDIDLYLNLGQCYERLGQSELAIYYYKRRGDLVYEYADIQHRLLTVYEKNIVEEAESQYFKEEQRKADFNTLVLYLLLAIGGIILVFVPAIWLYKRNKNTKRVKGQIKNLLQS